MGQLLSSDVKFVNVVVKCEGNASSLEVTCQYLRGTKTKVRHIVKHHEFLSFVSRGWCLAWVVFSVGGV